MSRKVKIVLISVFVLFVALTISLITILTANSTGVSTVSSQINTSVDNKTIAKLNKDYINISLEIPDGWEYEINDSDKNEEYGISFWRKGQKDNMVYVEYCKRFLVCGTGLTTKKTTVGKYSAIEYYYGGSSWDFIRLENTPGCYVVMNYYDDEDKRDKWFDENCDEIMKILDTLVVGEGIITENQAVEIAKKNISSGYYDYIASFDAKKGVWEVEFCENKNYNHGTKVLVDATGNVLEK